MVSIDSSIKPDREYLLPRGGREAVRLTAQHHLLIERQGWLLHPTVADSISQLSNPRIVDVATGTGIWAIELAQRFPRADIVGLDISDKQFPPRWTWPSNTSFDLYDVLEDVPGHLRGVFDVVHVRLLVGAGPAADKSIFIECFRQLLRPGGWLQWDELSYPNITACYPAVSSEAAVDTVDLADWLPMQVINKYLSMKDRINWIHRFEEAMAEREGFELQRKQIVPIQPHLLQTETGLCAAALTELIGMLISNKDIDDQAVQRELQAAVAQLRLDVDNGVLFSYSWNVCTARKLSF